MAAISAAAEWQESYTNMIFEAATASYIRISQMVDNTAEYIQENIQAQEQFNASVEEGKEKAGGLSEAIEKARNIMDKVSSVMKLSDQMTESTNRLSMMNDGMQTTQELQNMIYLSAQRTRSGYEETADAVSKFGLMAGSAFGSSAEIVSFAEQVSKQLTLAGAGASDISPVMDQVVQAMGSGALKGKEYTDILQKAPGFIQTIADSMGVSMEQMNEMAAEAGIPSEKIKEAMFAAADESNARFAAMPATFSQVGTSLQNTALMAFQPVLAKINEIGNNESFQELAANVLGALSSIASVAVLLFGLLAGLADIVSGNWSWLAPIIYGVAAALAVYYGWQQAVNIVTKVSEGIHNAISAAQKLHAFVMGALTTATGADTAAQTGLNAAMAACPIVWIVILIIALIALFYAAVAAINQFAGTSLSATGIICGGFMVGAARIGNVIIALINFVIDMFVVFWNFIATFVNFFGNSFNDPVGAIARLFFDLVDCVLGLLETLASAIDTIFGSDLAGSVRGWRDSLSGWVDDTLGEGEEFMEEMDGEKWHLDRFEYDKAWDKGYSFGEGIEDKISSFDPSSLLGDSMPEEMPGGEGYSERGGLGGMNGLDGMNSLSGLDGYGKEMENMGGYGEGMEDIGGNVGGIAENTGMMADSMELTEEDLKYMRDMAEQEAVNRFTTAEIFIEQTNHNTIKGRSDLDGIISDLTNAANEAVDTMAEGVHK